MKKIISISSVLLVAVLLSVSINAQETTQQGRNVSEETVQWPEISGSDNQGQTATNDNHNLDALIKIIQSNNDQSSIYLQVGKDILTSEQQSTQVLPADSLINLFILAAYYRQVESGVIKTSDKVQVTKEDIVEGAGALKNLPLDEPYDYSTLLQLMLQSRDLTATNVLIKAMGGVEKVNELIKELGFVQTHLAAQMGSGAAIADNKTSASDVANLLLALYQDVLFKKPYNEAALKLLSQHGPVGIAATLDASATLYGALSEQLDGVSLHDALLWEKSEGFPVVFVVLTTNTTNRGFTFGDLSEHFMPLVKEAQ
ncbi:serine hydrolase [Aerococcaceae bacterium zg-BR22]|uniref:serine hydrolase n=1 Tax=Aerococcaceae bacterium zg-1292 TaxID=2774330 RepID=UPI004064214A|nr:serine hydrolase [Aerococcaceae bacterium zg-BR22]